MADLGFPIRMKFIPSLAYSVTRHGPTTEKPPKARGWNWAKALGKTPFNIASTESQGRRLEPSREKYLWEDRTLV